MAQPPEDLDVKSASGLRVFISASKVDYDWRDRLKAVNQERHVPIDWWDDSRIPPGANWAREIEAAIRNASVAVILLSPDYLSSKIALSELSRLSDESDSRGLKLFPILVKDCHWREVEILARLQIWSYAQALSELPESARDTALIQIATSVLSLASANPESHDPPPPEKLNFSTNAAAVLDQARMLADKSRRKVITSSCLLYAFAETTAHSNITTRFVREALSRNGAYNSAFQKFLADASSSSRGGVIEGLPGSFSFSSIAILRHAETIAQRVSHATREIHTRHLFAALLVGRSQNRTPSAWKRLASLGIDLTALALDFLKFVRDSMPDDDQTEWEAILAPGGVPEQKPTPPQPVPNVAENQAPESPVQSIPPKGQSPYVTGTPGYNSEYCGVGGSGPVMDQLGVADMAHRLAELMVLRETKLPLAVGLFGNWGSGKSFFMNLIDRHMKALCKAAAASEATADGRWCKQIVPIYFNAWHYSDTNLWASLVTEVFDKLFAHLNPKTDELALLQANLKKAGGVTALAAEEASDASKDVVRATKELNDARADSAGKKAVMRGLLDGLKTLLPELDTRQNEARITELLGVSPDDATLSALIEKRKELSSIGGRIRELCRRAVAPEGMATRFGWLAGALIVVSLGYFAAPYVSQLEAFLRWLGPTVRAWLVPISAVIGWMTPVVKQVQNRLGQMEEWQRKAENAQAAMPASPQVIEAQQGVLRAEARASAALTALAEAKDRELELTQAVDNLMPQRRLSRFIEGRAQSADYRGQLGLVSLARRDFDELSRIFADAEALQKKIAQEPKETEKDRLEKLGASLDRVILFIDDLDRCEPEKVVDVLQAVHLLLAYPLFGVFVGVDQRCLKQSLRIKFKGLLTQDIQNDSARNGKRSDEDEIPATPLDYLEKIFHIPFHLPPMGKDGFLALVENLTEPPAPSSKGDKDGIERNKNAIEGKKDAILPVIPVSNDLPLPAAILQPPAGPGSPTKPEEIQKPSVPVDIKAVNPVRVVGSVPLHRWERDALKDYHLLIRTPRGATRMLNTYRLVRAGVPAKDWDAFRGDEEGQGEFRVAMLLLAAAAGQPSVARDWFHQLRQLGPAKLSLSNRDDEVNRSESETFRLMCQETFKQWTDPVCTQVVTKWLDRVERFAF